ncbi:SacI domain-containing protein [Thecamonas trahens ATCC 50062]|uniref:SacI domain-containing protein n=1 Tax=Thecamonas trahens ATCC 50062 TaxID=461836 RepID=A0A0L0DDE0_THETB|nr:SacI domain-containing protein [Thecamonas trahens ATCC 50062]KNC49343.1 SacI domain-containing protein [Thecamonas trahens ATCC 50062]|eukprot:XP_013758050.1 SacI domain-containing protein [Thecamonas trahens ATCC 50062]
MVEKKWKMVGYIGPHRIYKIAATQLVYLPHPSVRIHSLDEGRYTSIFSKIELVHDFFFSYTYDLSHSLQYNMKHPYSRTALLNAGVVQPRTTSSDGYAASEPSFPHPFASMPDERTWIWNLYLLKDVWPALTRKDWVLPVVHGFFRQRIVTVFDAPLVLTLIARRSRFFAGTRYLKRGVSDRGKVANEVETEQIVANMASAHFDSGSFASYVTLRGSIPLHWSQEQSIVTPKPPIVLHAPDPAYSATALHFEDLYRRYGSPLLVLNLVKQREKVPREQIIGIEFAHAVAKLNKAIPPEHRIRFHAFDMHRSAKTKDSDVIAELTARAKAIVATTGFFHAGYRPARVEAELARNPVMAAELEYEATAYGRDRLGLEQVGVARQNCIDSLDRTNAAQFVLGKVVLGHQLFALGLADSPDLEFDTLLMDAVTLMYEEMGDHIALQYGGSQLNHRVATYRNNTWSSYSRDMMTAIRRYYSNSFTDAEKQEATNLFLGLYVPLPEKKHLWALETDFYLHNEVIPRFVAPRLKLHPTSDAAHLSSLPSLLECIRHEAAFWSRGLAAHDQVAAQVDAVGASLQLEPAAADSFYHAYECYKLTQLTEHLQTYAKLVVYNESDFGSSAVGEEPDAGKRRSGLFRRKRKAAEPDKRSIYVSPFMRSKGAISSGGKSTIERLGGVSRWMRVNASISSRSAKYTARSRIDAPEPFPEPDAELRPLPEADAELYATYASLAETVLTPATALAPCASYAWDAASTAGVVLDVGHRGDEYEA